MGFLILLVKYGNIFLVKLNKTKIKEKVMLSIKFRKEGKKHQKIMRVILVDSRKTVNSGLANEIFGWVDPVSKKVELKKERILEWISKGAQPTSSVHNLLVKQNIIEGKKVAVHKKAKKKEEAK